MPNQTMTKINNVIDLYEDRKISQFMTAVNLINGSTTGNGKSREKGKAVAKYEDKPAKAGKRRRKRKQNEASNKF